MLIYLDVCALQRPLDDKTQLRVRLEAEAVEAVVELCRRGGASLATSEVLAFEISLNPHRPRRLFAEAILTSAATHQTLTPAIESRAVTLQILGLGQFDAMHVASAEAVGADYLCTCDDKLLRVGRVASALVRVVAPLELLTELNL